MRAFAYQNKPESVIQASSGAAFQRLAEAIIEQAGKYSLYGATWTDEFAVEHRRIDDIRKIGVFSGSKYLRSDFSKVLPQLKDDLTDGYTVVFSGTPCIIASVLKFVKNEGLPVEKLYTVEIICHGTPEKKAWRDCVEWTEKKYHSRIVKVNFRDKRVGWKYYPTSYLFENGREIIDTYESQLYIRLFMSSLITTKGCFSCPFANMKRNADYTIGDFWGIEDVMPDFPVRKGVSLILSNTEKGDMIIERIKNGLSEGEVIRECKDNSFLSYQHNLNRPTEKPQNYEEFWIEYNNHGFDYVIKKYEFYTLYKKSRFLVRKAINRLKGI